MTSKYEYNISLHEEFQEKMMLLYSIVKLCINVLIYAGQDFIFLIRYYRLYRAIYVSFWH